MVCSSVSFSDCEGGISAGPPTPPPSYDKVMTAILQELKFLHMQSASQGELNELPCKDLLDGIAVTASLLCRHVHSLHNPKDPFHSEESKLSEHLSPCRFTLDQSGFTLWCFVSSSPPHCSYMLVVCKGTDFFCAVGHNYHINNEHCAASADAIVGKGQPTVVAHCCFRPAAGSKSFGALWLRGH